MVENGGPGAGPHVPTAATDDTVSANAVIAVGIQELERLIHEAKERLTNNQLLPATASLTAIEPVLALVVNTVRAAWVAMQSDDDTSTSARHADADRPGGYL